ncbi:GNAT family N-acetyltransferase [Formosa sp. PL04]|uniref:GNAT family N-acetyltransferase n=1 Tax=Formosa sp. PL04 TaxID=3081755 RepID=UPI0029813027|nr:GNAT family N-acetyltransferase [Formosa sp. PL04]MDW5290283.1 GNAT family N-acetyltransferase [Formosa sp. PL04]
MDIQYAKESDIPQIIELCKAHAKFEQADYEQTNKIELLSKFLFAENPSLKCLVVKQEELLIGYATFMKQFSTWDTHFYIYLDCLYLKENKRGKGLGKMLMEKIQEYGKSENCTIMQWQTPDFNKKAIGFYNSIGGTSKSKERFYLNI